MHAEARYGILRTLKKAESSITRFLKEATPAGDQPSSLPAPALGGTWTLRSSPTEKNYVYTSSSAENV